MTESKVTKTRLIIRYAVVALIFTTLAITVFLIGRSVSDLIGAVTASAVLAYLLYPFEKKLRKRISPTLSSLTAVLTCIVFLSGAVFLLFPPVTAQITALSDKLPEAVDFFDSRLAWLKEKAGSLGIQIDFGEILSQESGLFAWIAENSAKGIIDALMSFVRALPMVALVPVFSFYFLKDKDFFIEVLSFVVPLKYKKPISKMLCGADRIVKCYLRTELVVAVIVALGTVAGYMIVGVPYALVLGLFMGLCEAIPYFGPIIGAVPACIVVLIDAPQRLIATIAVVIIVQQLEGNFISPYLMGAHFDINPFTVIIVLFVFGRLFGFAGFLFAIPLYAVLRDIVRTLFNNTVKAG